MRGPAKPGRPTRGRRIRSRAPTGELPRDLADLHHLVAVDPGVGDDLVDGPPAPRRAEPMHGLAAEPVAGGDLEQDLQLLGLGRGPALASARRPL
jgi:hypothetical protein